MHARGLSKTVADVKVLNAVFMVVKADGIQYFMSVLLMASETLYCLPDSTMWKEGWWAGVRIGEEGGDQSSVIRVACLCHLNVLCLKV